MNKDDKIERSGPLSHVRVLDLSRIMAGPWAGQILADLGADVIKVERPGKGDDTRGWGPPFLHDINGEQSSNSGYYSCVNRGKKSITVDISLAEGQKIVRSLAKNSDIVLENFKVGVLKKYNIDYEALYKVNPKLIFASITGFGQSGPRASQSAYDFMIQALGGLMSVTGESDENPDGGPQKVGVPIVDLMTGMYTSVAVLAALARRTETGEGEYIDMAMLDVQLAFLANQMMNYLVSGKAPIRNGNSHPNIQPQNVYACRDGHIAVAVGNDTQFVWFAKQLGLADLPNDDRFRTNSARVNNLESLNQIILKALAVKDVKTWVAKFEGAGVPCGPINSIPDVINDPQVIHRNMVRELDHPVLGKVPQVVSPMRFKNANLEFNAPPPTLGEHTKDVLSAAGYTDEKIAELEANNVI
ncbi:MAG: CoA transferase [Alphaproteobacteria bacterium]|nr:MAG: CoA transferase [Alphaproteobacteria bacterium]